MKRKYKVIFRKKNFLKGNISSLPILCYNMLIILHIFNPISLSINKFPSFYKI